MIKEFGGGGGTGIALRGDWLYESTDDHVFRYKLTPGELVPAGEPERVIRDLPNGHQHAAKVFAFGADGSSTSKPVRPPTPTAARRTAPWAPPARTPRNFSRRTAATGATIPTNSSRRRADGYHFSTGHRQSTTIALNRSTKALHRHPRPRPAEHGRPQFYTVDDNAENPAEVFHEPPMAPTSAGPTPYWDRTPSSGRSTPSTAATARSSPNPASIPTR
ncbi:MAG: hypothetical protein WDM96_10085 [Lacunisphaera sp.]